MFNLFIKTYSFTNGAWYFDSFINYYIVKPIMRLGFSKTYKLIDNQLLEYFGPKNIYSNISNDSNILSKYHSGQISIYTFVFIIFICCFIVKF